MRRAWHVLPWLAVVPFAGVVVLQALPQATRRKLRRAWVDAQYVDSRRDLCRPEHAAAVAQVVLRVTPKGRATVPRQRWEAMAPAERRGVAEHLSACRLGGALVRVVDEQGRRLATFRHVRGYEEP